MRKNKRNQQNNHDTPIDHVAFWVVYGASLAMSLSYMTWHSNSLAAIHGLLGWIYVFYYAFKY